MGKISGGIGHSSTDESLNYDEKTDLVKEALSTTDSHTENSGSTNTGTSTTNQFGYNSGHTDTNTVGSSSSSTYNSGHTDTQQLLLSDEAVNHLANNLLEGTSGLAATVKGSNISGVYNDTARTLLSSDLVSRIAGDVEARRAVLQTVVGGSSSTTVNSGRTDTSKTGSSYTSADSSTNTVNNIGPSSSDTTALNYGLSTEQGNTSGTKQKDTSSSDEKLGWILCTELYKQGRMPKRFYVNGLRVFGTYSDQSKKGYYIWAIPSLRHLRAKPFSIFSRIICSIFNARAEYLSAEANEPTARKTIYGFFAKHFLYWSCCILSRTVARNYGNVNHTIPSGAYHANKE